MNLMFIVALFAIAKTWKQPKCPLTDEWIKQMWYIYTIKYYLAIKKNEIMPYAAIWMQLGFLILSEVSQKEKDKYHMNITYLCNLKYGTNEPIYSTETDSQTQRTDLWLSRQRGEGVGFTGSLRFIKANCYIQNG